MIKLSIISILALVIFVGCGTRPKGDSVSVDNRGNCKAAFVRDYEQTEKLIEAARNNGIDQDKPESREKQKAALEACEQFKTVHQNNICKAQDPNGDEVEIKAKDLNEVCEFFAKDVTPKSAAHSADY